MQSEWGKSNRKYRLLKESNLSFLVRPKSISRLPIPATGANSFAAHAGEISGIEKKIENLPYKDQSLARNLSHPTSIFRSDAHGKPEDKTPQPRVQFRLQSAKVGDVGKERNQDFITKAIIIEDKSLSLLKAMYINSRYVAPKHRSINLSLNESSPLDYAGSFAKDNGERPLSTSYFPKQNKETEKTTEEIPEPTQPQVKYHMPLSRGHSSISKKTRPNSMTVVKFASPKESSIEEPKKEPESRPQSKNHSKELTRHKVLVLEQQPKGTITELKSTDNPTKIVSTKDIMQLKKKKRTKPGHHELMKNRRASDVMNTALHDYFSEAASQLYYIEFMKKLLYDDHPNHRELGEYVRAALYKSLAMTRTLHGSFPIYEHLKKRQEMILLNPKNILKKGTSR